jgi:chemotaxis protein MotA
VDLATLIGILGAFGIVVVAMVLGGSVLVFVNVPALLIVIVGTLMVVLMKFSLGQFLGAIKVALKAFIFKLDKMEELIPSVVEMADVARKGGLLALEGQQVDNEFLKEGIKMLVDGHGGDVVKDVLTKDMRQTAERHAWGVKIFIAMGDVAPAMGMIGTLVGLVQMLSAMDDPKAIGPAMAVALLTTLYGAIMANMVAIPIADKLTLRKAEEGNVKFMIIDALMAIQAGQNPRVVESMLKTYLAPAQRETEKKDET